MGTMTFATEQAIREIYAKVFELCITDGNGNGTMSAFNHIGLSTSVGYATNIQLYENEWGFDGVSVTDMYSEDTPAWNGDTIVRAHTIPLGSSTAYTAGEWRDGMVYIDQAQADGSMQEVASPTQWFWTRDTAQRIFYVVANGNEMDNGFESKALVDGEAELTVYVDQVLNDEEIITKADLEAIDAINDAFGEEGFEIVDANMPDGMTADVENGSVLVSGYVTDPNMYIATVTVRGNGGYGYIEREVEIELLARLAGEPGEDVSIFGGYVEPEVIDPNVEPSASTVGTFKSVNYEIVGEAQGFTIAADGTLSGSISAGETTVTVKQSGEWVVQTGSGWRARYELDEYEFVREITFVGEEGGAGSYDISFEIDENGNLLVTYPDGSSWNLGNVVGEDGQDGQDG